MRRGRRAGICRGAFSSPPAFRRAFSHQFFQGTGLEHLQTAMFPDRFRRSIESSRPNGHATVIRTKRAAQLHQELAAQAGHEDASNECPDTRETLERLHACALPDRRPPRRRRSDERNVALHLHQRRLSGVFCFSRVIACRRLDGSQGWRRLCLAGPDTGWPCRALHACRVNDRHACSSISAMRSLPMSSCRDCKRRSSPMVSLRAPSRRSGASMAAPCTTLCPLRSGNRRCGEHLSAGHGGADRPLRSRRPRASTSPPS